MNYLSTNEAVWQRTGEQASRLQELLGRGVVPYAEFFRDELGAQDPGVQSYTAELRRQAERIVQAASAVGDVAIQSEDMMMVRTLPADKIGDSMAAADASPYVDQIMGFSPMRDFAENMSRVSPAKDLDRMNPATMEQGDTKGPLTPRAVRKVLEFAGLWKSGLTYVLQGVGVTVGSHVKRDLEALHGDEFGNNVTVINRENSHELPNAVSKADVVILAAGLRKPSFTTDMIHPGLRAVVGVGRTDIEPGVYKSDAEVLVTPPHRQPGQMGVGSITAVEAWDEILTAAEARAARNEAEERAIFDSSVHPARKIEMAPADLNLTVPSLNGHGTNGHRVDGLVPATLVVV